MKVAVIDGQGGGLGRATVEKIKAFFGERLEIIALGTNSLATSNMMKGGAHVGATGENSIKVMSQKVDVIIGPMAILIANSMMGEITPQMAEAVASSNAKKIVFPLNRCNVRIVGTKDFKMSDMISDAVEELNMILDSKKCEED